MPQKLNKAGKMQDYIPKGNGDASGEHGTSNGTNKNFTTSDKKAQANVITENKSVVVGNKGTKTNYVDDVLKKLPKDLDEDELDEAIQDELNDSVWYEDNNIENISQKDFNKMVKEIKAKYKGNNKANIIDDDLTKIFGENEKYDKSYSNNPKLEEKLKSNIVEKLNEEFKDKSDEYIRQNGFTIAKGIASSEIRKDEFKDLKFNSFGSDSSNFDNMVRASLEQRKDLSGKKEETLVDEKAQKEINDRISGWDNKMRYMMLSRMQSDVKYYLGAGGRSKRDLWAQDEKEHIAYMETLYNGLKEKPEWLSKKELENYKKELLKK